jgi:hypothetical protein
MKEGMNQRKPACALATLLGGLLLLAAGGCSIGPKELRQTHGAYNESVRQVDEEQLLRNIVHARYNEAPSRLDVSAIAAQYELSAQAEARPFFIAPNPSNSNIIFRTFTAILPDASVAGANRPTISMTPVDDGDAVRRFLTAIPLETLTFLSQTSWPVSTILRLWVERVNGVPNADTTSGPPRDIMPDFARFQRIAELCQLIQDRRLLLIHAEQRTRNVGGPIPREAVTAAAVLDAAKSDMEYRPRKDGLWELLRKERVLVLEITSEGENSPEVGELIGLLHLRPGKRKYDIVKRHDGVADPQREPMPPLEQLEMVPRSTAQVYFYMANGVEVPPDHLKKGWAIAPVDESRVVFDLREVTRGLFEVHACKGHKPPANSYIAICYRDYWFWIDDSDQASKASFALMLQLTRLDLARQRPGGPALTLPVGK